jgi:hypothetical protein
MDDATTTPDAQNTGATDLSSTKAPLKVASAAMVGNFSAFWDQALTEPIIITENGPGSFQVKRTTSYGQRPTWQRLAIRATETLSEASYRRSFCPKSSGNSSN